MKLIKEKIEAYSSDVTFSSLKNFILSLNIDDIKYAEYINQPENVGGYGRNILTLEPFECVLINWPAGVESAIHHHDGMFGYVLILEGELSNVFYKEQNDQLIEFAIDKYVRNGLIPEADGVIHKLKNSSSTKRAITLHFYYPAIHSFEGMRIFNTEKGHEGILSDDAKSASWSDASGHFKELKENAFQFISLEELNKGK